MTATIKSLRAEYFLTSDEEEKRDIEYEIKKLEELALLDVLLFDEKYQIN